MSMLPWLESPQDFPPINEALDDPNGLLAAGGDLSLEMLQAAYRRGIFPWYSEGQPILWWSPDPRCIIDYDHLHISRSLRKHVRRTKWTLSFDTSFESVIFACTQRGPKEGTWITPEMQSAYLALHEAGYAHSIEVRDGDRLIGGLYGVAMGSCFFGESMFSHESNASKVAFWALCKQLHRWHYQLIDCQMENPHLMSMGAYNISRPDFQNKLTKGLKAQPKHTRWRFDSDLLSNV